MNDDRTPLEPDLVDELLSAEFDGELDAAAHDFGMTTAAARARLEATPGVDERRAALRAAAGHLERGDEMDELLEARLRAKAVRAAEEIHEAQRITRRRDHARLLYGAGGVAAAIALVFAIAASAHSGPGSKSSAASAPALAPDTAAGKAHPAAGTVALGAFPTARALATAALAHAAGTPKSSPTTNVPAASGGGGGNARNQSGLSAVSGVAPATATQPQTAHASTLNGGASTFATAKNSAASAGNVTFGPQGPPRCSGQPPAAATDTEVLRATATLAGKPVVVLVFVGPDQHVVVVEDAACRLVNVQTTR